MAFVKERLTEKDKEMLGSWGIRLAGELIDPSIYRSWLVDHERDIYFVFLDGGPVEHPYVYALIWQEKKVIINVEIRPGEKEVHWLIDKILASKELKDKKEELVEIIKEIVQAKNTRKVFFDKFPAPLFVEEGILNG